MLIRSLRLKNIRSYVDEEIVFPEGVILLAGDVGSGKSSILLAVDFALFGTRRGELSGYALLRNGTDRGEVELKFSIHGREGGQDNKEIVIKRVLRRTNDSVVQDSGYIELNGIRVEKSPIELKQTILDLLDYPSELLTKKSLIYRYTVYTPQDEMKAILIGDKEFRLETLRRVFGIDKYKRIKENADVIVAKLRELRKNFSSVIGDLDQKISMLNEKESNLAKLNEERDSAVKKVQDIQGIIAAKREEAKQTECQFIQLMNLRRNFDVCDVELKIMTMQIGKNNLLTYNLEAEVQLLLEGTKESFDVAGLKEEIAKRRVEVDAAEEKLKVVNAGVSVLKSRIEHSEGIKKKIVELKRCPMCEQDVSGEHKMKIIEREDERLSALVKEIEELVKKEKLISEDLIGLKNNLDEMKLKERDIKLVQFKKEHLEKKMADIGRIKDEQKELREKVDQITAKKTNLEKEISSLAEIEEKFARVREDLDVVLKNEKVLDIQAASLQKELDIVNKDVSNLKKEAEEKLKIRDILARHSMIQEWIEDKFVYTVDLIEKKVMVRVYSDFSELFQKWFSMLMDTDILKVRLDEEFTPVIEQNGHDIDYWFLSGGEKTAAALAYRLALNQVINSLVSTIKTRDLIILDEPTDGFSSEQLDRMRFVLDELKMRQIIIVSHESKIEGFVDKVIRISKEEHVSSVIS